MTIDIKLPTENPDDPSKPEDDAVANEIVEFVGLNVYPEGMTDPIGDPLEEVVVVVPPVLPPPDEPPPDEPPPDDTVIDRGRAYTTSNTSVDFIPAQDTLSWTVVPEMEV